MAKKDSTSGPRDLVNKPGGAAYARRNDQGEFTSMDDRSRSLSQDVRQHAQTKKPKDQGDKGD